MNKQAEVSSTDQMNLMRRMLNLIAETSDPVATIDQILEIAVDAGSASGAALILFEEPSLVATCGIEQAALPSVDHLSSLAQSLQRGIHANPSLPNGVEANTPGWVVGVVTYPQQIVGVLWLAYDKEGAVPNEALENVLSTILDGLVVLARTIRSTVRQQKLGRNQSEFMRIVAHDLRSPLTAMSGFTDMLGAVGDLNEQQEYFVSKVNSGISQLTSLVDNFQDAGRFDPETGFYEMDRAHCDVTELVRQVVANHLLPAEKQALTLTTKISDAVPIINADLRMLERAVTNLVDNAIKYTPNGHNVEVGVDVNADELIISVKDDGLGISPENQKLLFERHVRIRRREHKKVKGSGLGLFIVRSVAQRHGGRAWVTSEEGVGTTFYIGIPLGGENGLVPGEANVS